MADILILLLMLVLSGLFSGSETALTSVSMIRAEALMNEGRPGAKALFALKSNTNRMLIAILIGNNLVNIGASAMTTVLATELFGALGPGLAVGGLTLAILVFGEITPKTFAARFSVQFSLFLAPMLLLFSRIVLPLVWILEIFTDWMQSLFKADTPPLVTAAELITMAKHGAREGTIEEAEQVMIKRIFAFNDLRASDIMIPHQKLFMLPSSMTIKEALPTILAQPFSRIPLYEGTRTTIVKVVYQREILEEIAQGDDEKTLGETGHDPLFVPPNRPVEEIFNTVRGQKKRLIHVVDAYGDLQGILTLEDMLEELVGEIHDELDCRGKETQQLEDGSLLVEGDRELRVLNEHFGQQLTGKPNTPINAWILEACERIPAPNESFTIDGLSVTIDRASTRRILTVRVQRPGEQTVNSEDAEAGGDDAG
ncbi:MAG: DUF21 domain-containing protein [Magnetococcales bacterium]|nr:DUF21 domain-containing protein [Magnetococcales bacterium]